MKSALRATVSFHSPALHLCSSTKKNTRKGGNKVIAGAASGEDKKEQEKLNLLQRIWTPQVAGPFIYRSKRISCVTLKSEPLILKSE